MWPFVQPKPRPSLRLAVQLGAGLLVPLWVAPAVAQGVGVVITPSPAMAPRDEREKLAPAVMAPAAAEAMRAEATANQLAWRESLKRMSEAEVEEPSRALAAYKRFFSERTMSPELGVEVGLKIAQLRSKLGDNQGALQTCEVLRAKYADEPSAALFALEKARVLMGQKQLAPASECVDAAMPELVALGPSRYREISDVLLKLVQANLDSGDAESKERAKVLCVGVEEVYLRWIKQDTIDHLWQRFEALQVKYQDVGAQKRAEELLSKVGDALLKMPVRLDHVEDAVLSFETASWLAQQGQTKQARLFYQRIPQYQDSWLTRFSLNDEIYWNGIQGDGEQARLLMKQLGTDSDVDGANLTVLSLTALGLYQRGNFDQARKVAQEAVTFRESLSAFPKAPVLEERKDIADEVLWWSERWQKTTIPVVVDPAEMRRFVHAGDKPLIWQLAVNSFQPLAATVTSDNENVKVRPITQEPVKAGLYYSNIVELEITATDINTALTVHIPEHPELQLQVPIVMEMQRTEQEQQTIDTIVVD